MGVSSAVTSPGTRVKPRMRGILHVVGFVVAVPLGVLLSIHGETGIARLAAGIFAASVAAMFGASALYHRGTWTPAISRRLRRLDHAGVYGLIAGTYTPFGLLALGGAMRITVLAVVWGGVLGAIVLKLVWLDGPNWLSALVGVILGWVGLVALPQLVDEIGLGGALLLIAGGLTYTLGALVYAVRRPDPLPDVFGYHELFHALVICAVALQYAAVAFFVLPQA